MAPVSCRSTVAVPPPSYHRNLLQQPAALHVTALTLVTTLHLLDLCRLAGGWCTGATRRPCPAAPAASRAPIARSRCC